MPTKDILESKKLNTVIVDDDDQSRKLLNILLKKFPQVNVVGEASNVKNALDIINEKKPDSIFLDICLGNSNGFELMDKISKDARVVFISAFDDYALKAFEVNALDYIQKPVAYDRLALTIERLLLKEEPIQEFDTHQNIHEENELKKNIKLEHKKFSPKLLDIINEDQSDYLEDESIEEEIVPCLDPMKKKLDYDDRIFVNSDGTSKFIKVSSIFCITAEKDYSYICLVNGKKILVLKSMVEWEARLTPKYFARIHRSTIVNLEFVDKIEKWFNSSYRVHMQNYPEPFQMSRRYAAKLKERFK
jgi:two-component system LytT family response regulator